jgi:hypothetical protein
MEAGSSAVRAVGRPENTEVADGARKKAAQTAGGGAARRQLREVAAISAKFPNAATLRRAQTTLNCTEVNGPYPKGWMLYPKVSGRAGSDLVSSSETAQRLLAENYVGLPF